MITDKLLSLVLRVASYAEIYRAPLLERKKNRTVRIGFGRNSRK